ncbi:MAG: hypothetical protein ACI4WM_07710 [Erysipelotrichaceae bacterium]
MDLYRKRFKNAKEVVAKLRPIDDLLFSMIGKYHPEILEEFLKIILNDDSLKFISSRIQDKYPALPPYKSAAMDFTVRTTNGIFIDFEAQTSHLDDIEKKVRLYECKNDSSYILSGFDYKMFPDGITVILADKDMFGDNEAVYEVYKAVRNSKKEWIDGRKVFVVNGEYVGDDLIGDYIHDFLSYDVEDMRLDSIRNCVKYFKLEEEKGFENMCEIIEQYARDEAREAIEKLEEENRKNSIGIYLRFVKQGAISLSEAAKELGVSKSDLELML